MMSGWKVYRHLPDLIEFGNKGSVKLLNQALEYPQTQSLRGLICIAALGAGTVILDPQDRAISGQRQQGYF